ncbi:MAG: fructose-bisphosphate aldolase, class [Thermotogaceae bacterium]|nr:fructose-bisphosphate aldolase, class [Thermotogaceae bacterium]
MESVRDMLKVAEDSIKAGVTGLIFGRNIWQNPDMEKLIEALKEIVHKNKSSKEIIEKYSI